MGNQASLNSQEVAEAASVASDSDNESDSRNKKTKTIKRAKGEDDFVVNLMMPTYYRADPLTQKDIDFAKKSWESIVNNTSTVYHELKKDPNFKFENCEVSFILFYDHIYFFHYYSYISSIRYGFTVTFTTDYSTSIHYPGICFVILAHR